MLKNYTLRLDEGFDARIRDLTRRINEAGLVEVRVKPSDLLRSAIQRALEDWERRLRKAQ